ncbi:MAG: PilZ domain-containing protein [Proteobacteria bacterium]|nr:PilZ domain-containing protein [Pseudomonadota bacterium]MBU1714674.1 PilZ domain-containing protein [Pseudomonadota bacterium]
MVTEEVRVLKRRHLIYYLEVYDYKSNELVGHLVDITPKGIKLVSKKPIETGKAFILQMMLPEGYFKHKLLKFECESQWCKNDVNPDFFVTGFAVKDVDLEAKEIILKLIKQLGFND